MAIFCKFVLTPLLFLSQLEGEATGRAIKLAQFVNVPLYVVHVMSSDALDEVARARLQGRNDTK
jgi:dihydroorotase-like cyclic amidohydrolase